MGSFNETTGADYQGKNVERLLVAEIAGNYDQAHGWAGYRQWLAAGRVVAKGQHGTSCLTVMAERDEDGRQSGRTRGVRGFRVFHWSQTVDLAEVPPVDHEAQTAADEAYVAEIMAEAQS